MTENNSDGVILSSVWYVYTANKYQQKLTLARKSMITKNESNPSVINMKFTWNDIYLSKTAKFTVLNITKNIQVFKIKQMDGVVMEAYSVTLSNSK